MYKKVGRKNRRPTKTEFEYQYYIMDLSAEEMAKLHNVKPKTIYNWAVEFRKEEEIKTP